MKTTDQIADIPRSNMKYLIPGTPRNGFVMLCVGRDTWAKAHNAQAAWDAAGRPAKAIFYRVWAAAFVSNAGEICIKHEDFPRWTNDFNDLVEPIATYGDKKKSKNISLGC